MKYFLFITLSVILSFGFSKAPDYWEILSKVNIHHTFDGQGNISEYKYKFHPKIHKLEGKSIHLNGFIWDKEGMPLTLCKFSPNSYCTLYDNISFDCYVQLEDFDTTVYNPNNPYTVTGIFHLEENDKNERFFKLKVQTISELDF